VVTMWCPFETTAKEPRPISSPTVYDPTCLSSMVDGHYLLCEDRQGQSLRHTAPADVKGGVGVMDEW